MVGEGPGGPWRLGQGLSEALAPCTSTTWMESRVPQPKHRDLSTPLSPAPPKQLWLPQAVFLSLRTHPVLFSFRAGQAPE